MFKLFAVLSLLGVALALPLSFDSLSSLSSSQTAPNSNQEVRILRNEREDFGDGAYRFYYETSDGQKREEVAEVFEIEGEEPETYVRGSYSYFGPDGVEYKVDYTADKNGFKAVGDHIPQDGSVTETTDEPVGLPASAINSLLG